MARGSASITLLLIVASLVQGRSSLDIRWYDWLDGSRLPAGLNISKCGSCQDQLLRHLDEAHQDMIYANKTMNPERILAKLSQRLSDIQNAYVEHATGHKQSSDALNQSISAFVALYHEPLSNDLGNSTQRIINKLELDANKSVDAKDRSQRVLLKAQDIKPRLDGLLAAHERYSTSISHSKCILSDMNDKFTGQSGNRFHGRHKFSDLKEHSAKQLEFIIDQANLTLLAQASDAVSIDAIYSNYVIRLHQLTNTSQELRTYTDTHAAQLILGRLHQPAPSRHIDDRRLEADLTGHIVRFTASLGTSHETLSHLSDLRHSIKSNDEREADERLVLSESHKDTRNLYGKLDRLKLRLQGAHDLVAQLGSQLDKLESLDLVALTTVQNLTAELSHKNANMSRWREENLVIKQIELKTSYDYILQKFHNEARALNEWSDVVQITKRVNEIVEHVHEINTTIASINKTMNLEGFLVHASGGQEVEWISRRHSISLLNATKSVRSFVLSSHENQLNQLKQSVLTSTADLDQARLYLNETNAFMKLLEFKKQTNENLKESLHDILGNAIMESSAINSNITVNLKKQVEEATDRLTPDTYLARTGPMTRSPSRDLDSLATDIRISNTKFEILRGRVSTDLNTTHIAQQTKDADTQIRASLKKLLNRVEGARLQVNQIKLGPLRAMTQRSIGHQLNLPRQMSNCHSPSYTSISFLMKIEQNNTAEVILLTEGSKPSAGCPSNQFILIGLRSGHLTVEINLGENSSNEIVDDEKLVAGRVYRVTIIKIGLILHLAIRSKHSDGSLTRVLSGPYATFDLEHSESKIYYGGFPPVSSEIPCTRGYLRHNMSLFTGQLDDLEVNEHKLAPAVKVSLAENSTATSDLHAQGPCKQPLPGNTTIQRVNSTERFSMHLVRFGRLAAFPRPKSNISSSFLQLLHSDNELDELLVENSDEFVASNHSRARPKNLGHIRELTISFKTNQTNALILHHARPDHTSFLSIYISGGRLMLAFNFDKKIRFESHFSLSDGRWHHLNLILHHGPTLTDPRHATNGTSPVNMTNSHISTAHSQEMTSEIMHSLIVLIDDKHLYHEEYNLTTTHTTGYRDPWDEKVSNDEKSAVGDQAGERPERVQRKLLYFGGLEDKYSPLLRSQQIPTSFHGCLADVTINKIWINLLNTNKSPGISLGHCEIDQAQANL